MAKFEEVFPDTLQIFNKVLQATDLERVVSIKLLTNNKMKEIGKVVKATDLLKHMSGNDVIVLLNESVFECLVTKDADGNDSDLLQTIVIEELLTYIEYDFEKDKLSIAKPDVKTFKGILRKYDYDTWEVLDDSIRAVFAQQKEAADESNAV